MKFNVYLIISCFFFSLNLSASERAEFTWDPRSQGIQGFTDIKISKTTMKSKRTNQAYLYLFYVYGEQLRNQYVVLYKGKKVESKPNGRFRIKIYSKTDEVNTSVELKNKKTGEESTLYFKVAAPAQELEEFGGDVLEEYEEYFVDDKAQTYGVMLGFSDVVFNQEEFEEAKMLSLSLKGFASWNLKPKKWDLSTSFYFTLWPLFKVPVDSSVRYFGLNAKLGYHLPWLKSPWDFEFFFGAYYATMAERINHGGYKDILGPQIFPSLTYQTSKGFISFYFKYAPILSGVVKSSFANREIALGMSYRWRHEQQRFWSVGLDYSVLNMVNDKGGLHSNALGIGAGYSW